MQKANTTRAGGEDRFTDITKVKQKNGCHQGENVKSHQGNPITNIYKYINTKKYVKYIYIYIYIDTR